MTTEEQRIEIPISKAKIFLMLIGSLTFVAIGLWLVITPTAFQNSFWGNTAKIEIAGYTSIIFFGLCSFFFIRKLPDYKPGLIIDNTGLTDHSSGVSAGQILWSDIEYISVVEIHRQKLIMIIVKNPQDYIHKHTGFKRKMMELNFKMYGTPLSITSNGLKISFKELLTTLTNKLNTSRL